MLLKKGVCPYEYTDSWERFNETKLPPIKNIYSELNLEDITDDDYKHAHKVWNTFRLNNIGEYHDLYVQTDTFYLLMSLKVLETLAKKYISLILHILYLLLD